MTIIPTTLPALQHKVGRKSTFARFVRRIRRIPARTRYLAVIGASILLICYIFFLRGSSSQTSTVPVPLPPVIVKADDGEVKVMTFNPDREMKILSWKPRVFLYPNFLSSEECDKVIQLGKDHLVRSMVVGQNISKVIEDRSSYGAWINYEDSVWLDNRISAVTHMPIDTMEQLHLLRYNPSQQYKPHYDYFPRDCKLFKYLLIFYSI
jgi:hypothetical protein